VAKGRQPAPVPVSGAALPAVKELREQQNNQAIGGLRNPNRAVAASPRWQAVGRRFRQVLEPAGQQEVVADAIREAAGGFGSSVYQGFPPVVLQHVRHALQVEFNAPPSAGNSGFDYELWKAILTEAGDPEKDVPEWLEKGCPTGIGKSIIGTCGIFPKIDKTSRAIENSKEFARLRAAEHWRHERHRNYKSFYSDDGMFAKDEVTRIAEKGFVELFSTWEDVLNRWPNAKASKVALLVKERPDGSVKSRLMT